MSRSFRHNWRHHGCLGDMSMANFRKAANKAMRRKAKVAINAGCYDEAPTHVRQVSNVWDGPRDGMRYLHPDMDSFVDDEYLERMRRK